MAGEARQSTADLIEQLLAEPAAFEFFQAVRLLLRELDASPEQFPARIRIRPTCAASTKETNP